MKYVPDRIRAEVTLYCDWLDDTDVIHLFDARATVQRDLNRWGVSFSALGVGAELTVELIWSADAFNFRSD